MAKRGKHAINEEYCCVDAKCSITYPVKHSNAPKELKKYNPLERKHMTFKRKKISKK